MDPNDKIKTTDKKSRYIALGKGEVYDRQDKKILLLQDGKLIPTNKQPEFKKDQTGQQVIKGNNGGWVGVENGKTYTIGKQNLMSYGVGSNFIDPTPFEPPTYTPNAQFLKPDPKTGVINYFGNDFSGASQNTQRTAPTAGAKPSAKPKPAPVVPTPTKKPNTAAQLLAGLAPQDPNDAAVGAYTNPNTFKKNTAGPLDSGLKPAIPDADPNKVNVTPTTTAPNTAGAGSGSKNWQSYLGIGTDLLAGITAMAQANRPFTPFKQPQAYDTMMREVTQRRNEGLPFAQRAQALQRTQNQYSTDVGNIARVANGSAGFYMSGLAGASANAQNAGLAVSALDQQVRTQNQQTFNNAAIQDMNREEAAYRQLHQEEAAAANSYAQAGAANFQQAGARIDYLNQYENPESFYNLLKENMTAQINGWGSYLRQPIAP